MNWNLVFGMGKKKAEQLGQKATEALVNFDPETATEAQIDIMSNALTELLEEVAKARVEYEREQREADEINKLHDQRMAAAENLSAQLEDKSLSAKKRSDIESSMNKLMDQIETMMPDVERENQEAADAKELLDELEAQAKDMAADLKGARKTMIDAQRDMKMADAEAARAAKAEERAEIAAGIKQKANGLNTALDAMRNKANASRTKAESVKMKTDLLRPTNIEEDDPNIAAAMAAVTGSDTKQNLSPRERLAALKKRK